jgi:hypothetical protein
VRFRLVDIHIKHPSPSLYPYIPYLRDRAGEPRGSGGQPGVGGPAGPGDAKEEVEYPSHKPVIFVKGKPQSIIRLLSILSNLSNMMLSIVALRIGVDMKSLLHYILPYLDTLSYPGIELGSSRS